MKYLLILFGLLCSMNNFAQVQFSDEAIPTGLWDAGYNYGVSVVDYNNDGLEDLYVTRTYTSNRLFKNNGDGTFTDVAESAGIAYDGKTRMGIWGDINNDGWMDLYLGNADGEADALYINNGPKNAGAITFSEIGKKLGMDDTAKPFAVVFGDIDNDSFLDIYVAQIDGSNKMWKNNGNLTFTDYTIESGTTDNLIAMGAVFFDYDNDFDLDLYLTHDGYGPNILYQNDGTGHFTDVATQANADVAAFGMGVDIGDVNNDGWLDIYITNYGFNNLLLNNGDGTFSDITTDSETGDPGMGWGTVFLDTDNSGWQDIYLANTAALGHPGVLYFNQGDNSFLNISEGTSLASGGNGYGVASFDYNNDGRIDFFVANSSSGNIGNHLFKNETLNNNHWVKVKTKGMISNRCGIGARVEVTAGGQKYVDVVTAGSGWAAQSSLIQHFGLGPNTLIDTLKVIWPSGFSDYRTNLAADHTYTIVEGEKLETAIFEIQDSGFELAVFPNPASSKAMISYELDETQEVNISIWNPHGSLVDNIFSGIQLKGKQAFSWPVSGFAEGLYFIKVQIGNHYQMKPIVILR